MQMCKSKYKSSLRKDRCNGKLRKSKYNNSLHKDKCKEGITIGKSVGNNREEKNQT